jgi:hypothetical protein
LIVVMSATTLVVLGGLASDAAVVVAVAVLAGVRPLPEGLVLGLRVTVWVALV